MKQHYKIKSLFLITVLSVTGYFSCYRALNTPWPANAPVYDILENENYDKSVIKSIDTFSCNDSLTLELNLYFSLLSGNPANCPFTCFLTGLPPGVSGGGDSTTFKLNYYIRYSLFLNLDTGFYPFYINVRTPVYGLQKYKAVMHVLPVTNNAPALAGNYRGSDPCGYFSQGSYWAFYTANVTTVPGHPNWIGIQNFRGLGDSIIVYCFMPWMQSGIINIPPQTTHGYTIYSRGNGYFGFEDSTGTQHQNWISIFGDTIVHGADTQTCSTQLKQIL